MDREANLVGIALGAALGILLVQSLYRRQTRRAGLARRVTHTEALQILALRRYELSTLIVTALSRGDGSFPNRLKEKQ